MLGLVVVLSFVGKGGGGGLGCVWLGVDYVGNLVGCEFYVRW